MSQLFDDLGSNATEEASELIQALAKARHFGMESRDPTKVNSPTNREQIEIEAADTIAMIDLMGEAGMIDRKRVDDLVPLKKDKKQRTMKLQTTLRDCGYDQDHPDVQKAIDELYAKRVH